MPTSFFFNSTLKFYYQYQILLQLISTRDSFCYVYLLFIYLRRYGLSMLFEQLISKTLGHYTLTKLILNHSLLLYVNVMSLTINASFQIVSHECVFDSNFLLI